MVIPESKQAHLEEAYAEVDEVEDQRRKGLITAGERHNKIIDIWHRVTEDVAKEMFTGHVVAGCGDGSVQPDLHDGGLRMLHADMIEVEDMLLETTVGRVLFNMELPEEMPFINGQLRKKGPAEPGRLFDHEHGARAHCDPARQPQGDRLRVRHPLGDFRCRAATW